MSILKKAMNEARTPEEIAAAQAVAALSQEPQEAAQQDHFSTDPLTGYDAAQIALKLFEGRRLEEFSDFLKERNLTPNIVLPNGLTLLQNSLFRFPQDAGRLECLLALGANPNLFMRKIEEEGFSNGAHRAAYHPLNFAFANYPQLTSAEVCRVLRNYGASAEGLRHYFEVDPVAAVPDDEEKAKLRRELVAMAPDPDLTKIARRDVDLSVMQKHLANVEAQMAAAGFQVVNYAPPKRKVASDARPDVMVPLFGNYRIITLGTIAEVKRDAVVGNAGKKLLDYDDSASNIDKYVFQGNMRETARITLAAPDPGELSCWLPQGMNAELGKDNQHIITLKSDQFVLMRNSAKGKGHYAIASIHTNEQGQRFFFDPIFNGMRVLSNDYKSISLEVRNDLFKGLSASINYLNIFPMGNDALDAKIVESVLPSENRPHSTTPGDLLPSSLFPNSMNKRIAMSLIRKAMKKAQTPEEMAAARTMAILAEKPGEAAQTGRFSTDPVSGYDAAQIAVRLFDGGLLDDFAAFLRERNLSPNIVLANGLTLLQNSLIQYPKDTIRLTCLLELGANSNLFMRRVEDMGLGKSAYGAAWHPLNYAFTNCPQHTTPEVCFTLRKYGASAEGLKYYLEVDPELIEQDDEAKAKLRGELISVLPVPDCANLARQDVDLSVMQKELADIEIQLAAAGFEVVSYRPAIPREKIEVVSPAQIGRMIEGKGIFMGVWKPIDQNGKSLDRTFNVFAAPQDLADDSGNKVVLSYDETIRLVAGLKNWHGYYGADYINDAALFKSLADGAYNGEWFIPPRFLLKGKDRKTERSQIRNLYDLRNAGDLRGTITVSGGYWSCTENLNNQGTVWTVSISDGKGSWNGKEGLMRCRLCRAELVI